MESLYSIKPTKIDYNEAYAEKLQSLRQEARYPHLEGYMAYVRNLVQLYVVEAGKGFCSGFNKTPQKVWEDIEAIDISLHFVRVGDGDSYALTPRLCMTPGRGYDPSIGQVLSIKKQQLGRTVEIETSVGDAEAAQVIKAFCDQAWGGV